MADFNRYILFLVISFELVGTVLSKEVQYGPSIAYLTSLQPDEKKSGNVSKRINKIFLEDFPNYSTVVPLLTGKFSGYSSEIVKERGTIKKGRFAVEAPKGYGIMAVIQELDFPVETTDDINLSDFVQQKFCSDYIKFRDTRKMKTTEICGKVDGDNKDVKLDSLFGPRSFISPFGKMLVTFQQGDISDLLILKSMNSNTETHEDEGNTKHVYKLEIVFTAFKNCDELSTSGDTTFVACGPTDEQENETCIKRDLFCDDNINCGIPSQFAYDERNCVSQNNITEPLISAEVTEKGNISSLGHITNFFTNLWQNPTQSKENVESLPLDFFSYHPNEINPRKNTEGSNFLQSEDSMFDNFDLHITPTGVILLIILTIATVMILSVIVRFCCYRCVGKDPETCVHPSNASTNYGSTSFPSSITSSSGRSFRSIQSYFGHYVDTPPAYEDLFPNVHKPHVNPGVDPSASQTEVVQRNEERQSRNSSTDGSETQDTAIKTISR